jgi:teichuronic acid biosynthesis glycosyltransferase TuaC
MRALVVSNMEATPQAPQRGSFVRDQVAGLRSAGVEVETVEWQPGSRNYLPAIRAVRRKLRSARFDVVHAHYGLSGWCALLAGADPLVVTFHGTDVRHRWVGPLSRRLAARRVLVAAASRSLFEAEGGRAGLPAPSGRAAVLPCGASLERFTPRSREECRRRLGLDPAGRFLLFPASPGRAVKRHDRALAVAEACDAELLTLGTVAPDQVAEWVNAAAAVLITSENEGFGLAAVEALACDVAVISTPVGIAPHLLGGLAGCHVGPWDLEAFAAAAGRALADPGTRVAGRVRAAGFAAEPMAERVAAAYRDVAALA